MVPENNGIVRLSSNEVGINSITVQTGQALNIHDASGNLIRNITSSSGISTFASVEIAKGTGDLKVGVSTFFVDHSAGEVGIGTVNPQDVLDVAAAVPQIRLTDLSNLNFESISLATRFTSLSIESLSHKTFISFIVISFISFKVFR